MDNSGSVLKLACGKYVELVFTMDWHGSVIYVHEEVVELPGRVLECWNLVSSQYISVIDCHGLAIVS